MNEIITGDCIEIMRRWADDRVLVNMCVTSPPYFGLRDYNIDGQIGMEKTPDEYIQRLVEVFRSVHNILRADGTLWLNLGDSYAATKGQRKTTDKGGLKQHSNSGSVGAPSRCVDGLQAKNLIGIPWRVALALQADGWYLRQDIIWSKPNPMPESVKDRCTKSHEYIFLLSKTANYYYDNESIKETSVYGFGNSSFNKGKTAIMQPGSSNKKRLDTGTRNKRSVWTISTQPYGGAHFAVFPPKLIEPCVLAGCPKGGVVLDPFMGSGTTAAVAIKNNRNYLGCELNPAYSVLQSKRLSEIQQDLF